MYSMLLTKDYAYNSDVIVMNADVFVEPEYIRKLVNSDLKNCILVEKGRFEEKNMKITYDGKKITDISKQIAKENAYGTTIDMYKFSKEFTIKWFEVMEDIIYNQNEKNMWNEVAIDEMLKKAEVQPLEIGHMWYEIDNHEDLEKARNLFKI